jgi:hypothetical protein
MLFLILFVLIDQQVVLFLILVLVLELVLVVVLVLLLLVLMVVVEIHERLGEKMLGFRLVLMLRLMDDCVLIEGQESMSYCGLNQN